ncbi:hypothetical protein J3R83DRAFT_5540 [Lanmaoa asiatica]|nr:hypothetical protein J3R83DRAFT_8992 [Lanmaoa asiatica]KAH0826531.1 hypothetical protein J3R83DRAFT_5540 [Lanmaoa asiatica]
MPTSKTHHCESCSDAFPNKTSLRRHRYNRHSLPPLFNKDGKVYNVVHNKGRLECPFDVCPKAYLNRDDFQAHLKKAHGVEFETAEGNASGPDVDKTCQRGADGTFDLPQASDFSIMLISSSTVLGVGVPFSSDREGINATGRIEAICGHDAGGVLHVGRDAARLEGKLDESFCSIDHAHIIGGCKRVW